MGLVLPPRIVAIIETLSPHFCPNLPLPRSAENRRITVARASPIARFARNCRALHPQQNGISPNHLLFTKTRKTHAKGEFGTQRPRNRALSRRSQPMLQRRKMSRSSGTRTGIKEP